jgi:hypothetical protein
MTLADFLSTYVNEGIYKQDPFVSIDQGGVGKLVTMATTLWVAA